MTSPPGKLRLVTVHLACGCTARTKLVPFHGTRFGCTSGLGHGYQIDWVQADQPNGVNIRNQRMRGEK